MQRVTTVNNDFGFRFECSYLSLPKCFYAQMNPMPIMSPEMVIFNDVLAKDLGLDFSELSTAKKTALFSGNARLERGAYFAQAYSGHQFGH